MILNPPVFFPNSSLISCTVSSASTLLTLYNFIAAATVFYNFHILLIFESLISLCCGLLLSMYVSLAVSSPFLYVLQPSNNEYTMADLASVHLPCIRFVRLKFLRK